MPFVLSADLWKETGRWHTIGKEVFIYFINLKLYRFKDRKDGDFLLAPTHEECVTSIVAFETLSYKKFPIRLYQIGTKFRDEFRPRHGLMRGKEFLMKDLYSFDKTIEEAYESYNLVYQAYCNIFKRLGLDYLAVEADTGNIGGTKSHEFQIISETGEDTLIQCECGKYGANIEKAIGRESKSSESASLFIRVDLKNSEKKIIKLKTSVGREANLIKLKSYFGAEECKLIENKDSSFDQELIDKSVDPIGQDYFTNVIEGDLCTLCDKKLHIKKGIEVGHVFYLGTKYSSVLKADFKNQEGKILPTEMGCYGIGVSRVLQSIVETSNDDNGIIWPLSVAPFKVSVIPSKSNYIDIATQLSQEIEDIKGWDKDVLLDDRFSVGNSSKEASSLGLNFILIIGKHYESDHKIEMIERKSGEKKLLKKEEIIEYFKSLKF